MQVELNVAALLGFIARQNCTHKEFAERMGIKNTRLSNIIKGRERCSPAIRKSILRETDGDFDTYFTVAGVGGVTK